MNNILKDISRVVKITNELNGSNTKIKSLSVSRLPSMSNNSYKVNINNGDMIYLCKSIEPTHLVSSVEELVSKSNSIMELTNQSRYKYQLYDNLAIRLYDKSSEVLHCSTTDEYYYILLHKLTTFHNTLIPSHYRKYISKFKPSYYYCLYMSKLLNYNKDKYLPIHNELVHKFLDYDKVVSSVPDNRLQLIHCDLTETNILYNDVNNSVNFIDFEYSGLGLIEFDLGTLLMYSNLSANEFFTYVDNYYGNYKYDKSIVIESLKIQAYLWSVWSYYYYEFIVTDKDYKNYLINTYIPYLLSLAIRYNNALLDTKESNYEKKK